MTIVYHPAIAEELEEIRDCYESKSAGLGMRFVDEFERLVLGVASMPTLLDDRRGGYTKGSDEALPLRHSISSYSGRLR